MDYKKDAKAPDIISAMHQQIQQLEEHYQEQLRQKDIETFQSRKEAHILRYQLNEAQRRLELPVSMQLAEAQKRIHDLETKKLMCDDLNVGEAIKDETVDDEPTEKSTKERKLEKKVKNLQNQLESSSRSNEKLKLELETMQTKSKQKEMEYRRLIAASCNLPIEKVDGLVGPLTLAIESDPPDLDMTRVIGFMERLRKQNNSSNLDSSTNTLPTTPV